MTNNQIENNVFQLYSIQISFCNHKYKDSWGFVITLTKLLPRHNNLLNRFSNGTRSGGMSTQEEITHRYVAHRLQVQQTVQLVEISELLREVNSLCIHTDSNAIGQLSVKNLAAG